MYVPKSLKLNKFRPVQIPSGREIFNRFGLCDPSRLSYTGDAKPLRPMSKTDQAAALDQVDYRYGQVESESGS